MLIAGLDEAGRGPLAGPVIAACVILNPEKPITELKDSKKLSEKQREYLFEIIQRDALDFAIAEASVAEIDALNIHHASLLAMQRAYMKIKIPVTKAYVDGKFVPEIGCESQAIIGGDDLIPCISAASILAKVTRDRLMATYDNQYPEYGFSKHKGYPTPLHLNRLKQLGICDIHRKSYAPVKRIMNALLSEPA